MRIFLFLALIGLHGLALADVYTWRDAAGKVHYSDTPPMNVDAKRMSTGGAAAPAAASGSTAPSIAEQDLEFRKRKLDADEARAKAQEDRQKADERQRNCEQARNELNALQSGQRMSVVDATGARIPLDDAARAREIELKQEAVKAWCS